jgi:hypothetical protein
MCVTPPFSRHGWVLSPRIPVQRPVRSRCAGVRRGDGRFEGATVQLILASIDVRASVCEALRIWSEFSAPARPRQVDFQSVAGASRITVRLEREPTYAEQRELEQHLAAFKSFAEQRAPAALHAPHDRS